MACERRGDGCLTTIVDLLTSDVQLVHPAALACVPRRLFLRSTHTDVNSVHACQELRDISVEMDADCSEAPDAFSDSVFLQRFAGLATVLGNLRSCRTLRIACRRCARYLPRLVADALLRRRGGEINLASSWQGKPGMGAAGLAAYCSPPARRA